MGAGVDYDVPNRALAAVRAETRERLSVLREFAKALGRTTDHIGDATVMLPRDVAESLRDYLSQPLTASGMETHRAEADGMDEELVALCEALKEGR